MRERESTFGDEGLLLRNQSRIGLGVGSAMEHDLESPLGDPRLTSTGRSSGIDPTSSNQKRYSSTRSKASR